MAEWVADSRYLNTVLATLVMVYFEVTWEGEYRYCLIRIWLAFVLTRFKTLFVRSADKTEEYHNILCLYSQ